MNKQSLSNCIRLAALAALAAIPGLSCSYSVSVPAIPASGGFAYVSVNTQAGCDWAVEHTATFLSYYGVRSGRGPGTVILYATPNSGAARSATVRVSDLTKVQPLLPTRSSTPLYLAVTTVVQY